MMSAPALSLRLQALFDLSDRRYDQMWDLCCDHGYLGLAFLAARRADQVHLVDQVPSIMDRLARQVGELPEPEQKRVTLHVGRVEDLSPGSAASQLFVLAGVGGEKCTTMLQALANRPEQEEAQWLLAPANDVLWVRQWLQRHGFGLLGERAVTEQNRCYDLLWVSRQGAELPKIPSVGRFWRPDQPDHAHYLRRLRQHYRNCLRSPDRATVEHAEAALAAYASVMPS